MTRIKIDSRETLLSPIMIATQNCCHFVNRFSSIPLMILFFVGPGTDIEIACGGEIISHRFESQLLSGNLIGESPTKTFYVYLPDSYDESDERYPTAYWFTGGVSHPLEGVTAKSIDEAIQSGRIPPAVIAFMPVSTRFGPTVYMSSDAFGDWEGFLNSEVIPFVDDTYRTRPTGRQRGIMGHSLGGFDAVMQPLLHPDTWGAIGTNDPSTWLIVNAVREPEDIPREGALVFSTSAIPASLAGYRTASWGVSTRGQIGARLSPNHDSPVFADFPKDRQGEWIPEIREKWRAYDIADPEIVGQHLDTLRNLATVSVVIPEARPNNVSWNVELIETLQAVGVNATRLDMPGDHEAFTTERFLALLKNVVGGLVFQAADFSGDGALSAADVDMLTVEAFAGTNASAFDLTGNHVVDNHDLTTWLTDAARQNGLSQSYLSGDSNLDGTVDAADLNNLALHWRQNVARWSAGDFTFDGVVNSTDLNELALHWRGFVPFAGAVPIEAGSDAYVQTFDEALGSDGATTGTKLPTGWTAIDDGKEVHSTTGSFPIGINVSSNNTFSAGIENDPDRALAIGIAAAEDDVSLEFLAHAGVTDADSFQLRFDLEAWDSADGVRFGNNVLFGPDDPGEAAFKLTVDIDSGDGFVSLVELGTVTTGPTLEPVFMGIVDGNADANRMEFDSGILSASIPAGSKLRFRWAADVDAQTEGWVFGLDNVALQLFAGDPSDIRMASVPEPSTLLLMLVAVALVSSRGVVPQCAGTPSSDVSNAGP